MQVVVPNDTAWKEVFAVEAIALKQALGSNSCAVHHIGSTAVPGILAKPIIDCLVEVIDLGRVDDCSIEMEVIGYEVMGEFGITGRRYFRKTDQDGVRTHHVHVFEKGSPDVERHLAFREFLCCHPAKAKEYSDLKEALTSGGPPSWDRYIEGKESFVKETERLAVAWYCRQK